MPIIFLQIQFATRNESTAIKKNGQMNCRLLYTNKSLTFKLSFLQIIKSNIHYRPNKYNNIYLAVKENKNCLYVKITYF